MAELLEADLDDPLIQAFFSAGGRRAEKAVLDMQTHFTPLEMALFARRLAESDLAGREAQLERPFIAELRAARTLQAYRRQTISADINFYSDGAPPAGKTLLVCFGGLNGRLGLPTANFLQRLEAQRHDVLVLRDRDRLRFRMGAGSFAPDFMALVRNIERRFHPEAYDRVVTFGNSMGGVAALQVGMHLGAERAIAIGARVPDDPVRLLLGRPAGPAFDPICDCRLEVPMPGLLVHAGKCPEDVEGALALHACRGGRLVVVPQTNEHNLAGYFWGLGELERFMSFLMEAPLPRPRHDPGPVVVFRKRLLPRIGRAVTRLLRGQKAFVTEKPQKVIRWRPPPDAGRGK